MSETHEPHEPHDTPAGAAIPDQHGTSQAVEGQHGSAADHGDGHGHDDHAHPADTLGPIDWSMWAVGVIGVAAALAVTAALVFSTGFVFGP